MLSAGGGVVRLGFRLRQPADAKAMAGRGYAGQVRCSSAFVKDFGG